jgi:hypothetical protein
MSILVIATTICTFAARDVVHASIVCGMIAVVCRDDGTTISVTVAPRARMAVKRRDLEFEKRDPCRVVGNPSSADMLRDATLPPRDARLRIASISVVFPCRHAP